MWVSSRSQRGGSKINLLMTLCLIGGMVFVALKIFPPYVTNYQLQDMMQSEVRFAVTNRKTADDVQADVWRKIQELGIPAKQDAITVTSDQGLVGITVNYSVPIDLIVYQYNMQFHLHSDNHLF